MVASRIIAAFSMAFVVGAVMSFVFRKEESKRTQYKSDTKTEIISKKDVFLLLLILVS